jgi:3-oxoacyl-[acyl-carrier protein] reductase
MDLGIKQHVYLVTGGSSGLGLAGARALVAEGARVAIVARSAEGVARTVEQLGSEAATGIIADLADEEAAGHIVSTALAHFGRLDGALLSVGGPPAGAALDTTDDLWRTGFESTFLGPLRLIRALGEALPDSFGPTTGTSGAILLVLSTSARAPIPDLAVSNGLRPGLAGLTKQLGDEFGGRGIRINAIAPGRFATDRVASLDARSGDPAEVRRRVEAGIPLGRYGDADEFGSLAAFALSPRASYLTGTLLTIDGGASRQF